MDKAERWGIWEIELQGPSQGNPFVDVALQAEFRFENRALKVQGFYDGDGIYRVRCMPDMEGIWSYRIVSSDDPSQVMEGSFTCIKASSANHGSVRVIHGFHFAYEDDTSYLPIGTTCYAWTHQGNKLEEQTLKTLASSPFNKIRMCIFPKYYDYNHDEPAMYPFAGSLEEGWDYTRYNVEFFRHLENRIHDLMDLGIEADLILFHPYDRWGFSTMDAESDDRYLSYVIARLGAYRNVWWSLANEYDLMRAKTEVDWERFARVIMEDDPYGHLRSIHNCFGFYDHSKPWVTHCSVQRQDVYKTAEYTDEWRNAYRKPVVIDECGYEGNLNHGWGNLIGRELVRRCWEGAVRGGYVGHGETYLNSEEVLWWSKGGELIGQSVDRIAFLKKVLEEGPRINPISFGMMGWDLPCGGVPESYYLFYFGFNQPSFRPFKLPAGTKYRVDIIDTWDMTVTALDGVYEGEFTINLPAKPYIAVRMCKVN